MSPLAIGLSFVRSESQYRGKHEHWVAERVGQHTDSLVKVFIRHIVDRAACGTHDQSTEPKQTDICEGSGPGSMHGIGRHGN